MTERAPLYSEVASAPQGGGAFWLRTSDGFRIRAAVWEAGARGSVFIFPGRTEYIEKYGRVAGRIANLGFSVAVIDWRGQGLSDRFPSHPELGHVDDFRDYQRDVDAFVSHDLTARLPAPRYLFAHSMGGCIGLRTLLERSDFSAAVFSAPMWGLQIHAATREIATKLARFSHSALREGRQAQREGPDATPPDETASNPLTSDPEHLAWFAAQLASHPELKVGGPSLRWTYAALEEMARLRVAPLSRLPVLALLGGEERIVSEKVIRIRIAKMASGSLAEIPGARHEIWMERPEIQDKVWRRISDFLEPRPV